MKENDSSAQEKLSPEEATAPAQENLDKLKPGSSKRWFIVGLIVFCLAIFLIGATVGYLFIDRGSPSAQSGFFSGSTSASSGTPESTKPITWTCSMHPQFKLPKPGKCPICFMDLIPLVDDDGDEGSPRQLKMSPRAVGLAEIQTEPVRRKYATKEIRLVGKIDYDETKIANITAWTPGRLDRLFVDFTGVSVRKGDHLVSTYIPSLASFSITIPPIGA